MLEARGLDQREFFSQGGDRLRAVGRIQHAAWVGFKGDQSRSRAAGRRCFHCSADDVEMSEVDSIKAADRQRHRPDRTRGEPNMKLQLSTF